MSAPRGRVDLVALKRPLQKAELNATDWKTPGSGCQANAVCYTPQGSVYNMSLGQTTSFTGFNLSETFNNRLQPNEIKASSSAGNAIDITYSFVDPVSLKNSGHVYAITNNLTSGRSQTFTYDQVNRIISAGTTATTGSTCWGYQFSYDAWGNLLSQTGWTPTYNACTETTMGAVTADGNNHISGLSYDSSGNTLSDGNNSYTWDGESQLKTAAGVTYNYDGDGRRAAKVGSKLYWYGSGGEILSETDSSGNTQNDYVFFDGKRVAMAPSSGSALYYAEDSLGSSRVIVQATGTLCYDADFTPFGGEKTQTNSCAQNYKFEGKERDTETQNDDFGARYYSWRLGRWLSSDWSAVPVPVPYANLNNPQTLNLYAMASDDPETFADLDGHWITPGYQEQIAEEGNAQAEQQTQATPEAETKKARDQGQTLPDDPSKLGPEWVPDPSHKAPNGERLVRGDGTKVDFHRGQKGAKGSRGKDHWHVIRPGQKKPDRTLGDRGHIAPGTTVDLPVFAPRFSPVVPVPTELLPNCSHCEGEPDPRGPGVYPGMIPGGTTPDVPVPALPPLMPAPELVPI